jgi:hypothetical protein
MINLNKKPQRPAINNVMVRKHTIPIKVKKLFTDINGQLLSKSAIPTAMQTRYPVYMLGEFDKSGGFRIGQKIVTPSVYYLQSFVHGVGCTPSQIIGFTGLDEITGKLQIGDIVTVYTDSLSAPTTFAWIIQTNDYAALGSIIGNSETSQNDLRIGTVYIYELNYFTDVEAQLNEPLHATRFDNIGTYSDNQIQPSLFKNPYVAQEDFLTIEVEFKLDQYLGLYVFMIHESDQISMNYKIKKIN